MERRREKSRGEGDGEQAGDHNRKHPGAIQGARREEGGFRHPHPHLQPKLGCSHCTAPGM